MSARYDQLYKQLFGHPEMVRDLLAGFLDAAWARSLDVSAFERVNASYAGDHGKQRHEDVVWRAKIGGEWVYVYILLEFQSRPDRWMALRMQVYSGLLYQDLVAQHKLSKHGKLPPVLPVVLYHGRQPWSAAIELADLMLPAPEGLQSFQARQRYMLIDQYHGGAHGNIVALLFRALHARTEAEAITAAGALSARLRQEDMASVRESLQRWLQLTLPGDSADTIMDFEEDMTMPARRKIYSQEFFRQLLLPVQECREEGRQEGRQEGLEEGERLALQGVLNDMLVGKEAPHNVAEKIAGAGNLQLRAWIKLLIDGASPRQVFAEG